MKLTFDGSYGPVTPHMGDNYGLPDFSQDVQHLGTFHGRPDLEQMLTMMPQWKAQLFAADSGAGGARDPLRAARLRNLIG